MKRPKKKEYIKRYPTYSNNKKNEIMQSYNQGRQDMIDFLPSKAEMELLVTDGICEYFKRIPLSVVDNLELHKLILYQ